MWAPVNEAAFRVLQVDLHIGTLSKAVGAQGGFVCCSHMTKQLLVSKARSQIYSTALPLPVVAAALEAVRVSYREWWRRRHLWRLVELAGSALGAAAQSPILPLVVGSEQEALDFSRQLLEAGLHVPAIRPPTVPQGMCRLRLTLSAAHSFEDVGKLVQAIHVSGREFRGIDTGLGPRAKL
ncbi:unnamed protein product [Ostreobium quekettii]|uniref:Aminotransferase class I/classII large domain-containing protein n=1 Tax=Ostreobium quekettii TaxID=121088 RepID=A0A8S1JEV3_9CHLO|nr:unnamed protein product [Ostreobium quekettii]